MIRYYIFLLLFFLFIIEGTAFQIFAPDQYGVEYLFVPRWTFIVIIFAGIFRGRGVGTFYGIIFGVMYDVIYTSVLGVYAFGMGLIAYLLSISISVFQKHLTVAVITCLLAITILDYYVYGMMYVLGLTSMVHEEFLHIKFIPSLIMNGVVISVFAYPLRKWFYYIQKRMAEED